MDSSKYFGDEEFAVILFAHGSAVEQANEGVRELARKIQDTGTYSYVQASFLGPGQPDLGQAIATAAEAGFRGIVVIPYFLTLGIHLRRDLPRLVVDARRKHPHVEIHIGNSLEDHPEMASLILSRIREVTKEVKVSA